MGTAEVSVTDFTPNVNKPHETFQNLYDVIALNSGLTIFENIFTISLCGMTTLHQITVEP